MSKKIKKIIFISLPILFGFGLIWYSLSKFTPSDFESIINSFKTAHYGWVLLSILLAIMSHLSRAYRCQFLLEPLGYKPKFTNSVLTVLIAYLLNLVIPRSGEIASAAAISKYEDIPFEKAFGTIVAERVADVIMLFIIIGIAFFMQTELVLSKLDKGGESSTMNIIIIFTLIVIIGYILFRIFKKSKFDVKNKGIYFQTKGPRFETKAEVNLIKNFANVVGMTMSNEATLSKELNLEYASTCCVDNYANGVIKTPLTQELIKKHELRTNKRIEKIIQESSKLKLS